MRPSKKAIVVTVKARQPVESLPRKVIALARAFKAAELETYKVLGKDGFIWKLTHSTPNDSDERLEFIAYATANLYGVVRRECVKSFTITVDVKKVAISRLTFSTNESDAIDTFSLLYDFFKAGTAEMSQSFKDSVYPPGAHWAVSTLDEVILVELGKTREAGTLTFSIPKERNAAVASFQLNMDTFPTFLPH